MDHVEIKYQPERSVTILGSPSLVQDDSGLEPEDSVLLAGYQYVDWQFDGDALIYVVRTAARGARNFRDSNRILFGRERGFRFLLSRTRSQLREVSPRRPAPAACAPGRSARPAVPGAAPSGAGRRANR